MPLYDFQCDTCARVFEAFASMAERDQARPPCGGPPDAGCPGHGGRLGVQAFALGKAAYQCHAILGNGQKVRGHFGKTAAMLRRPEGKKL